MVLFSAAIHKRRRKKLISETIKYKLDSSSKIQFPFFYPKDIQIFFWETIDFAKHLEMKQIAGVERKEEEDGGVGGVRGGLCVIMT